MTVPKVWSHTVELNGKRVTVFEMATRKNVLYLRWKPRPSANWKHSSLDRTLRTADGRIIDERRRWAIGRAKEKLQEIVAAPEGSTPETRDTVTTPITIAEGRDLVMAGRKGKYHSDTPHRREVARSLDFAIGLWGAERTWNSIRRADLRELGRAKLDALLAADSDVSGHRASEVVMRDVIAVANWLRSEELIAEDAAIAPREWKKELVGYWIEKHNAPGEPVPFRPRHTLTEMRAILLAAPNVDPRLHLELALGAEQRSGQVRRTMRSMVTFTHNDHGGVECEVKLSSRGKKIGAVLELTQGQLAVLEEALTTGYLRLLEAAYMAHEIEDYPLFPGGQMPGSRAHLFRKQKNGAARSPHGPAAPTATVERHANAAPVLTRTIRDWFHEAEDLAGVEQVPGRASYGLRRVAVDAALGFGISEDGMQEHGGWLDAQTPNAIYKDQNKSAARKEARDIRARIRGES